MALDPRIALMGTQWQAPDFQGALAKGQEYRQNQMTMQAAQDTAARNAMVRQRAAQVDYNDPASVNMFVREIGPDATPYIQAAGAGDTLFNTRAAERRAAGEHITKQGEAYMTQLPRFAAQLLGDASPARRAAVRQMAIDSGFPVAQYDALDTQLAGLDPAAQQQALQSFLLTTPGGKAVVETRFGPRTLVNTGATQEARNLNPLALDAVTGAPVPVTGPIQNTADPRAPTIFSSSQGVGQIAADGSFTPVTGPGGAPVMPYVAPRADAQTTDALGAQAASAETLRDVLGQLRTNFDVLYQNGFMRGGGVSPVGNVAQFVGDAIPGVRGARLSANSAADTASGNVESLLSTAISTLSALYGTSSRVMDAVREMENARSTFGGQNLTIEAARNMVDTALRRVDELEAARARAGGGDVSALETEARRRGLIP